MGKKLTEDELDMVSGGCHEDPIIAPDAGIIVGAQPEPTKLVSHGLPSSGSQDPKKKKMQYFSVE